MQLLETVRIGVAQAVAEEIGEQQVEAIPLAFAIQRQEEQLHGLQALQQRLAVLAPGQGVGQVAAQLAGNARGQQRFLQVARQAFEDRRQQIGADRLLVAVEQGHFLHLRLLAQPQADEMHAHHPAFGLAIERLQAGLVQIETAALEVFAGFLEAEAQLLEADFQQQPLGPPGSQAQRRLRTRAQGQDQPGRRVLHQAVEAGEDVRVANQVQVVEHQQQRPRIAIEIAEQAFDHRHHRDPHGVLQVGLGVVAKLRHGFAQRLDQLPAETGGVVVFFGKREPGHRLVCYSALLARAASAQVLPKPAGAENIRTREWGLRSSRLRIAGRREYSAGT